MKEIYIIGESHTRHFAYRQNIYPIFMGSGKAINLDNVELLNSKISKTNNSIKEKKDKLVFLYLGEPNCRIKLCNHWTPHWDELHYGKEINSKPNYDYISKSIENYKKLDMSGIDYILTPTVAYDPVIPSLIEFNKMLKETFAEKVIDIFQFTIDDENRVLNKYKAKDWLKDPIHLNSRICCDFLNLLHKMKIIEDENDYQPLIEGYFGTHLLRCADKTKFGSFIIKDEHE